MECAIIVEDLTLAIPVKFGSNWFSSFSHVLAGSRRIEELVSRTSKTSFLQSLVSIGLVVLVVFLAGSRQNEELVERTSKTSFL